ncbi:MAG TPA: acyltransferase family protein [Dongiaceae bacterium]|nr:acyltransferase family protein [Dongiaceae bacterium]
MPRTESSASRSAEFRPEIQGVRALGALLVASFHIWFGRVSGGVDVFFIVSGYLILGSLLRQAEKTGRIDLIGFAYRLSKRLLPAAFFVILAVLLGAWLWLPQTRWEFVIKEAVASTLYLENWRLIRQSVDYLARDELPSPFQHYWAISIQGQFYVIFGIGIALHLYLSRKAIGRAWNPLILIGAIFAGSLAYSIWLTIVDQPTAYFSTFTRLWEFALGGILAAVLPRLSLSYGTRLFLGWIGFVAILSCGAVLQVATLFPGYAALWPTFGACCVIAAGRTGSKVGADAILASRPLAYIGDISYSLYLWHWPLLIFYRAIFNEVEAGLWAGLAILAISIVLSAATQRYIEQPFINLERTTANPWPWLAQAAAAGIMILSVAGGWYLYVAKVKHDEIAAPLDLATHPGALAFDRPASSTGADIRPGPLWVRDDKPVAYDDGCHQSLESSKLVTCVYGDKDAPIGIAIVGGSHSLMWLPAFQEIAARRDLKIITMTKSSCLFSSAYIGGIVAFKDQCATWNKQALAKLLELKPSAVFTIATRGSGSEETIPQAYVDPWRALAGAGIQVIAIRDTPWMRFDVAECVEIAGADAAACSRPRKSMLADVNPIQRAKDLPSNVRYIDLSRFFCSDEICPPVAGNVLIYSDAHHITATYARTLGPALEEAVFSALLPTPDSIEATHRSTGVATPN